MVNRKLDTDTFVYFYEQEFYVLSNFSSFGLSWHSEWFTTSEHAYHWTRFPEDERFIRHLIKNAPSAHEAFTLAQHFKPYQRTNWDREKVNIMEEILIQKALQNEYVYRKLMETGSRALVEDSWRDGFWGSGEDNRGQNQLGLAWMRVRERFKAGHFSHLTRMPYFYGSKEQDLLSKYYTFAKEEALSARDLSRADELQSESIEKM